MIVGQGPTVFAEGAGLFGYFANDTCKYDPICILLFVYCYLVSFVIY